MIKDNTIYVFCGSHKIHHSDEVMDNCIAIADPKDSKRAIVLAFNTQPVVAHGQTFAEPMGNPILVRYENTSADSLGMPAGAVTCHDKTWENAEEIFSNMEELA